MSNSFLISGAIELWAIRWVGIGLMTGLWLGAGLPAADAEVLVTQRISEEGVGIANRIVSWPSLSAFIANQNGVVIGKRMSSSPGPLFTIDPQGDLISMEAAPWDPTQLKAHRYRDAYDYCQDDNLILGVVPGLSNLAGVTYDAAGQIYAIAESASGEGSWTYSVKRWPTTTAFLSQAVPETLGTTRSGGVRHVGLEIIEGKVITLVAGVEAGARVYQVWDWGTSFAGFLQNQGVMLGTHRGGLEITSLFSPLHAVESSQQTIARRPSWPWLGNRFPDHAPGSLSGWRAENAFPSLTFEDPVQMIPQPRSNRLWVIGRQGHVWWFEPGTNPSSSVLALDLSATTMGGFDGGLLGIAFHPDFGKPGAVNRGSFFLWYNYRPAGTQVAHGRSFNRLSRFTLNDAASTVDPASERVLINQYDEHDWHNGGGMFFGPDGFLYLSVGDEGGADDAYQNSQRLDGGLFGGVLRLDVDRDPTRSHPIRRQPQAGGIAPPGWPGTFSQDYWIPDDNPWVDPGGTVLEEFWAIGLRSPHRMSRDEVTGEVFIGDIGQAASEEVDVLRKGANYQWAYREGGLVGPKPRPNPLLGVDTPPLWSYTREQGDGCVIGGLVYRGTIHAEVLGGRYLFGDHASGRIWAMDWENQQTPKVEALTSITGYTLAGFGTDHAQELYLMTLGKEGRILKLVRTPSPQPPATLSATGAFTDLLTLRTSRGILPYGVNSPLWSDHAEKQRWIVLPNNGAPFGAEERITFLPAGEWQYPAGTVLIKHFELPLNEAQPELRRRLETRFLVKTRDGEWYGVTYKWRADGSDADLLLEGETEPITVTEADGGTRTQAWYFPSQNDCTRCHIPGASQVLGLRTWQLNGPFAYPGTSVQSNQLRVWSDLGMFDQVLSDGQISGFLRSAPLSDESASRETRVRSYLDANCAHCHRPGGVPALFDARFSTPLAAQGLIDGELAQTLGIPGAHPIAPGSTDQSMVHLRMTSDSPSLQMPPLGRGVVHREAIALLEKWIHNLIPPASPTALIAVPTDYGRLMLSWNAQSTNASHFVLQRSFDGAAWATVAEIPATAVNHTLTGLPPATGFLFRISAVNEAGASAWSAASSATTWPEQGSWEDWQRRNPQVAENGPLQNPDMDSAVNLLEYALGGDPLTGGVPQDGFYLEGSVSGNVDAVVTFPTLLKGTTVMLMGAAELTEPMQWTPVVAASETLALPDGRVQVRVRNLDQSAPFLGLGFGMARLQVRLDATGETAHTETWFWDIRNYPVGTHTLGATMLRPEVFSGTVMQGGPALAVSGGDGWKLKVDPSRPTYLEVRGGPHDGHRFDINEDATRNGVLTLDLTSPANTANPIPDLTGASFAVREHWTLGELFAPRQWISSTNPQRADRVQFFSPTSSNWESYWLVNLNGTPRWVAMGNATLADQSGRVIEPGQGLFIRKVTSSTITPWVGIVRATSYRLKVPTGLSLIAPGFPRSQSPADWRMNGDSGFVPARSATRADQFLRWRGDFEAGAPEGYGTHFFLGLPSGNYWTPLSNSRIPNDNLNPLFPRQSAIFIRTRSAISNWVQPRPWTP